MEITYKLINEGIVLVKWDEGELCAVKNDYENLIKVDGNSYYTAVRFKDGTVSLATLFSTFDKLPKELQIDELGFEEAFYVFSNRVNIQIFLDF